MRKLWKEMLWPISSSKPAISLGEGDYKTAVMIPVMIPILWAVFYINECSMPGRTVRATERIINLNNSISCQYWGKIYLVEIQGLLTINNTHQAPRSLTPHPQHKRSTISKKMYTHTYIQKNTHAYIHFNDVTFINQRMYMKHVRYYRLLNTSWSKKHIKKKYIQNICWKNNEIRVNTGSYLTDRRREKEIINRQKFF